MEEDGMLLDFLIGEVVAVDIGIVVLVFVLFLGSNYVPVVVLERRNL